MDLFGGARTVRLLSRHGRYLVADQDTVRVAQGRSATVPGSLWTVEYIHGTPYLRLRSCYGRYLTASDQTLFFSRSERKVLQTAGPGLPLLATIDWEPIRDGYHVKLRTIYSRFLRANGRIHPWHYSVTHHTVHTPACRTPLNHSWVLWVVQIVTLHQSPTHHPTVPTSHLDLAGPSTSPVSSGRESSMIELGKKRQEEGTQPPRSSSPGSSPSTSSSSSTQESLPSLAGWLPRVEEISTSEKLEEETQLTRLTDVNLSASAPSSTPSTSQQQAAPTGRTIYYSIADDYGYVSSDDGAIPPSITFQGRSISELTEKLEEAAQLGRLIVCARNPVTGTLFPLYLDLPPINSPRHFVLVRASSPVAKNLKFPEKP